MRSNRRQIRPIVDGDNPVRAAIEAETEQAIERRRTYGLPIEPTMRYYGRAAKRRGGAELQQAIKVSSVIAPQDRGELDVKSA